MEENQGNGSRLVQSAAWIIAVLTVAVILALVLGGGRQVPAGQEGTSTEEATGTSEATEVAATEAPCMVTADNSDVDIFAGLPGVDLSDTSAKLLAGESAPVTGIDDTQNDNAWYQIEYVPPDGSAPSAEGWVNPQQGVTVSGGCDSVPRATTATAEPCLFVADGSDFKVYAAPDGMDSLGLIFIQQSAQVYSFSSDSAGLRWIEVDFEGQHGWIAGDQSGFSFSGDCATVTVSGGEPTIGLDCTLTAGEGGSPVFSEPQESNTTLIDRLDAGVSAAVLGKIPASNTNGGLEWYQIVRPDGSLGWTYQTGTEELSGACDLLPIIDADGLPDGTPTLNPNQIALLCILTVGPDSTDVYSQPDTSSDVITTLSITQVQVFSYVKQPEGLWYQVGVSGTTMAGFVQADMPLNNTSGDCSNLPAWDEPTQGDGGDGFSGEPDYVIEVSGDVGTEQRFTRQFPDTVGRSMHIIEIHVDIPEAEGIEGRRNVEYYVGCDNTTSKGAQDFHWGWYGFSNLPDTCGSVEVSDGLLWSDSIVHFVVMANPDIPLTYTFIITVSEYLQ